MSGYLWKYYLEDDVGAFRHLLEGTAFSARPSAPRASYGASLGQPSPAAFIGSPGSLGTSPTLTTRARRDLGGTPRFAAGLTRADVNSKDANGLTILHHAASSTSENALSFAAALLEHPLTDLYAQDFENGWTALHRAFYFGNVAIARSIMDRDVLDALGHGSSGVVQHAGGLVKIKDKEGNGPLDLFAATIADRTLRPEEDTRVDAFGEDDDDFGYDDSGDGEDRPARRKLAPAMDIHGDELFTFGSNRNVTLGFGDEDDRQFPERIILRRPDHLLRRFYREHLEHKQQDWPNMDASVNDWSQLASIHSMPVSDLPTIIRSTPLLIQDVKMSKLSTAVLTTDPESNLYMCGHGPGGRVGTGDETTRFQFTCIEGGALAKKKVIAVALGQNHSLALSDEGEIFSWGNNGYGQLGYGLPKTLKDEDPVQLLPRQIFGPLKKEIVIGIAASRIHSVVHTSSSLYTFGKNEGQLGIVDSDARSLESQVTPRKVAASLFSSPIKSVSAIERATVCLLENHEVWVFANYGYAKVSFPLDGFSNYFLKQSFLTTKYDTTPNRICKITAGGDNICALSTNGEIYTVAVSKRSESGQDSTASTTNPSKIRGALSQPYRIWSLKKGYMAARDVDVDQDGSVILTTQAGTVWRRVKRAKIKDATASGTGEYRPKDYKFLRVPGLTRVTAVRASAFGAYAAVRKDCDVTKTQVQVDSPTLWDDVFPLLPFGDWATQDDELDDGVQASEMQLLTRRAIGSKDFEQDLKDVLFGIDEDDKTFDMVIGSTVSEVRIPVHQWIFAGRSKVLRQGLAEFQHTGTFSLPEALSLEEDDRGRILLVLQGMDVLTMFNLVLYFYTDNVVDFWHYARQYPKLAFRYRQVRTELMKLSSKLELKQLEPAVRQMVRPRRSLTVDMELAVKDPMFFENGDVILELADSELRVHSALMVQRCPFFEGMFKGRAAGLWLAGRREASTDPSEAIRIDLKHIELHIFELVLRHLYADSGDELFDDFVSDNFGEFLALNEFLDHVMDVLSVANELMLDRLSQVCQQVIGRYVNVRNICQLLNALSPCSVTEFKDAGLEYICLSLEAVLQNGVLDELDEDLILELDQIVRENQVACLPIAKSGRAEALLFEKYPELAEQIDRRRRAKVDAIMLQSKYADSPARISTSLKASSYDDQSSPMQQKARRRSGKDIKAAQESPTLAPALKGKGSIADLMFDMDDDVDPESNELDLDAPRSVKSPTSAIGGPVQDVSLGLPTSSPWQIPKATSKRDASDSAIASPSSHTPRSLGTPMDSITTSITRPADKPWGTAPLQTSKLDMKNIMAETSSTQPSNISLALSAQAKDDRSTGSFAATKLSQKERKKLQQQQAAKGEEIRSSPADNEPRPAASPWQMRPPAAKVALKDVMSSTSPRSPQQEQQQQQPPTKIRPNLTMRQTIANNGPASKPKSANVVPTTATSAPSISQFHPSDSNKNATPVSGRGFAIPRPDAPSSSTPALPQSIRHIAAPSHAEASLSMGLADILSMQQAEKESIAAAAAKRSLQEIQQEQEFQEWWDKESKRVMEEERDRARRDKRDAARAGGSSSSKKTGKKAKGEQKVATAGGDDTTAPAKGGGAGAKKGGSGGSGGRGKKGNAGSGPGAGPAPEPAVIAPASTTETAAIPATSLADASAATAAKPPPAKSNKKQKSSGKPGKQQQQQPPHPSRSSVANTATAATPSSSPVVPATTAVNAEKTPPTGPRKQQHHHHRPRGAGGAGGGSGVGPGKRNQQHQQHQAQAQASGGSHH
ncbi:btb domain and ankyrin repeat protein [Diplodia corticola]|uniref:Btb domain and ankyrin repeat protein n=1 Tax=Diplodia corticola TaxID=236234 RepID=A0A1J9QN61_9PEZI|nr:btb domain and ankyrin repeat protein [Diplodia corticola]OJD30334.1 btb domain and ankyrin repeat protein [Diplodia corticola]